ncbi:hypothetical protein AB0G02_33580, partial [Actinosynnema sp. NPDC023658]
GGVPLGTDSPTGMLTGVIGGLVCRPGTPVGGRPSGERHDNRMPTLGHGLFDVESLASPAVIGETAGAQL